MKFTVYETASGRIVRVGECPPEFLSLQAEPGEAVVEGGYSPIEHKFVAGVPVALPPRPSAFHAYDYTAGQWTLNSYNAWAAVRRRRNELLAESDYISIRAQEGGPPMSVAWRQYRQALRDITTQADPLNIVWPTPPAA